MKTYADSNFLPLLYLRTKHTTAAIEAVESANRGLSLLLPMTRLHRVEIINAIQLYVHAGRHGQRSIVTPAQAAVAQATFREDLRAGSFLRRGAMAPEGIEPSFEELSLRHSVQRGFRTYDLMHVAHALIPASG